MSLDPVKIPANVQVEEKIFGPIGLRQIMILMISGGLSYALWSMAQKVNGGALGMFGTGLCWMPLVVGAAFAFIKVNDVSLFHLLLLGIEGFDKPSVRRFSPRAGISITLNIETTTQKKETPAKASLDEQKIEVLSTNLDKGPTGESAPKTVTVLPAETAAENPLLPHWRVEETTTGTTTEHVATFHDILPPSHA